MLKLFSIELLCELIAAHELKYEEEDYTLTDYENLVDKFGLVDKK